MLRFDRQWYCRRCGGETSSGPLPFVLPGARPVYAPDRVCDVRHLQLELTLDFERRRVAGVCRQMLAELNAVEMEIEAVELAGGGSALPPPRFEYDGRLLSVDLGVRLAGEQLELAVRYAATPRRGLYFIGPEPAYPQRPVQVWSQGQDEDNRYWF